MNTNIKHNNISKVAEISLAFWVLKILTTGMGEAFSDFLNYQLHISHLMMILSGVILLTIALTIQFSLKKYVAWSYWLVVSLISIYGTAIADGIDSINGVSFLLTTIVVLVILIFVFIIWYHSEKTLSIHSIFNAKRESFYWLTVLLTFVLGTAVGDLTASTFNWGTLYSGIFFTVLIVLPLIGVKLFNVNKVTAFWISYILTRPLGASFSDWLSQPARFGGVGFGSGLISAILIMLIIFLIIFSSRQKPCEKRSDGH